VPYLSRNSLVDSADGIYAGKKSHRCKTVQQFERNQSQRDKMEFADSSTMHQNGWKSLQEIDQKRGEKRSTINIRIVHCRI
jgi:paraquat-inducible protein B